MFASNFVHLHQLCESADPSQSFRLCNWSDGQRIKMNDAQEIQCCLFIADLCICSCPEIAIGNQLIAKSQLDRKADIGFDPKTIIGFGDTAAVKDARVRLD
jgi:hypothetical protein